VAENSMNDSGKQQDIPQDLLDLIRSRFGLVTTRRGRPKISLPTLPTPTIGVALFWATVILYFTYWVHAKMLPPVPEGTLYTYYTLDAIRQKLWQTDWVTPAILWTFLFGMFYLRGVWVTKYKVLADAESSDVYKAVMVGHLDQVKGQIETAEEPSKLGYYGARLHALVTRWNADSDLPAVQALKNEILEIDEENVAHSFVPVAWSESALPLLGFLGTVIGIGQAIGSISGAIKILLKGATTTGGEQLDTLFNKGFENMALAFDTTFFGLFFLLLLGVLHIYEKRKFADRLDSARRFYSLTLAQLPQGSTNVLVVGLSELTKRVEAVEGTLKVVEEDAIAYKNRLEGMVDHVIMEVPQLEPIRKALMKPVVQFAQLEARPALEFQRFIHDQVRADWTIAAVGLTAGTEVSGMVSLSQSRHDGKSFVATFGPTLNEDNRIVECAKSFLSILPVSLQSFLGVAHSDSGVEFWIGFLPDAQGTVNTVADSEVKVTLSKVDLQQVSAQLKPVSFGGSRVLVAVQDGISVRITSITIEKDTTPTGGIDLSPEVEWKHWDANPASDTLVVAGSSASGGGSRIEFVSVPSEKSEWRTHPMRLPGIAEITHVQAMGPSQCVFTDKVGSLFYMDETRNEPMALKHQDLPANIERILSNKRGWLAVVANSRISMWNCRRGGFIYPYDGETLTNTAVSASSYSVSAEGRYLYNFAGTLIVRWSFPKAVGDQQ